MNASAGQGCMQTKRSKFSRTFFTLYNMCSVSFLRRDNFKINSNQIPRPYTSYFQDRFIEKKINIKCMSLMYLHSYLLKSYKTNWSNGKSLPNSTNPIKLLAFYKFGKKIGLLIISIIYR